MIINAGNLRGLYVSYNTTFNMAFKAQTPQYSKIATEIPSTTKETAYPWLGQMPRMREWLGERVINQLTEHDYSIKNKTWEATVAVKREDIEDDQYGVYRPMVEMIGMEAAMHPDELTYGLLHAGFATPCFDGQYFFDANHPGYAGVALQSNRGTKKLGYAGYATARTSMMGLLGENGRPLGIIPDLLVVAPSNEGIGRSILYGDLRPNDAGTAMQTNEWKGTADLAVAPWLAQYPNEWFLMCTKWPLKPLIFQRRKQPQFAAMFDPSNPQVFMHKEFTYGVDDRKNVGFGLWQFAYGSDGTVAA